MEQYVLVMASLSMRVKLRCTPIPSGDQYVMMDGMSLMQKLSVEKLVSCLLLLKSKVKLMIIILPSLHICGSTLDVGHNVNSDYFQ